MNDKVVGFKGNSVRPQGEPVAEVVEMLQGYLDRAKSGQIVGVAIVVVEIQPVAFKTNYTVRYFNHTLVAGVAALQHAILRTVVGEGDDDQ